MTNEQKGKYITLLALQHQNGKLSEDDMLTICGSFDAKIWAKFRKDEQGFYYNERMLLETERRAKYNQSRRKNLKTEDHMDAHMEIRNKKYEIEIEKGSKKYNNIPPQLSEITERMAEREITSFTADAFFAFYESKGWKVGSQTMRNWDAALTTWNNREHDTATKAPAYAPKYKTYDEMCQLALNNKDIWQQMTALNLPDMPKTVWAHPNDVAKHNLTKYAVK